MFKLNKLAIVFVNAVIFTLIFNASILIARYRDFIAAGDNAIYELIVETIFSIIAVLPIIYCLSWSNIALRIILVFIYLISGLVSYFICAIHISITPEIIGSFFESSLGEIKNFLSLDLMIWLLCSGILALICIKSIKSVKQNLTEDKRITFVTAIFTLSCLFGDGDFMANILPYNILKYSGTYWLEKLNIKEKRLDLAEKFQFNLDNQAEDLNVILIIGESGRGDHFSLSGYKRLTDPLLSSESNLIYYKNVTACYPLTRVAVPCMITRATRENRKIALHETSFIGIFRKLGFYTAWFGMQGTYTAIDAPYTDLAKEANKFLLVGNDVNMFTSNDTALFPFVDKFLADHPTGKNLLILHTIGSHFHYEERYPDEFRKFTPICRKKKLLSDMSHCSLEERVNSYDNSISFTDYFVKNIIDRVKAKKALVIFTPDHGESLGEGGRFFHGTHNADEQVAVNMIFWASDKYIKSYPQNVKNLNKFKDKAILHDYLFHSILGCSGITSGVIQNKLNLCGMVGKN